MAFNNVTWAAADPVVSTKLQQMVDNENYLQQQVDNKMPKGILGGAKRVTSITGLVPGPSGASTLLSGLTTTITVPEARVLKITFFARSWSSNQNAVTIGQKIFRDAVQIESRNVYLPIADTGHGGGVVVAIDMVAAGTYSYQAGVEIILTPEPGSFSGNLNCDSWYPSFILVEDIGSTAGISIPEV